MRAEEDTEGGGEEEGGKTDPEESQLALDFACPASVSVSAVRS